VKRDGHPPFPPITSEAVLKLPRDSSAAWWKQRDPSCGRVLIALIKGSRVQVRNIYSRQDGKRFVECASINGRGVPIDNLFKVGWQIYRPPFAVRDPSPGTYLTFTGNKEIDAFDEWFRILSGPNANRWWRRPERIDRNQRYNTPVYRLLQNHWLTLGDEWTPERFCNLCRVWNLTPFELGAMIGWPPEDAEAFSNRTRGKPSNAPASWTPPRSILIWLQFLENFRFGIPTWPVPPPEELKQSTPASAA